MQGKRKIGIGYVINPTNIKFSTYVETCFKTKTVSITTEDSEIYHKIRLSSTLLSQVQFPDVSKGQLMGSIVLFLRPQNTSIPTIISVLDLMDGGNDLLPGQWRLTSHTEQSSTSLIQGDVKKGTLDIIVHSQEENSEINLRATSKSKESLIKVESDGEIRVLSDKLVQLNSETEIRLGEDNLESAVLGDTWKTFTENFMTTMKNATVATGFGPAPLTPSVILEIESQIQELGEALSILVKIQ